MCIAMAAAASGMVFKDAETRVTTAHKFALGFSAFLPRLPIVNCLLEEAFQNCPHSTFKGDPRPLPPAITLPGHLPCTLFSRSS
jgi:hypothetical protein